MHTQQKGIFIVIEGTDGSGKGTQCKLLADWLVKAGYDVATFDFPQYDSPSSYFVRQYLNGAYGSADEVGPYMGSLFYALDRFEAGKKIRDALDAGKIVLANRFVGSNMAHQGTKFANSEERRGYFIWLDNLEFEMLRIPRPDISFVLRVPAEIAQSMVDQKESRTYTDKKRDLHEADLAHLKRSVEVYDEMCGLFPKDFSRIDCVRNNKIMDRETIQRMLWEKIDPLLPPPTQLEMGTTKIAAAKTATVTSERAPANPYLAKNGLDQYQITDEGRSFLEDVITNVDDSVYAFHAKLSPLTIAAAFARFSHRSEDMRVTLLDEFATKIGEDNTLLQRIINTYGDDTIQQLAGQHIVVEGASALLAAHLERGRLGAYLKPSPQYDNYDQKDEQGSYKYHVPTSFTEEVAEHYKTNIDKIFETYSYMVRKVAEHLLATSTVPQNERTNTWRKELHTQACDIVRPVLPTATTTTVGIFGSAQAVEHLVRHLLSQDLPESRAAGEKILAEARKVMSELLEYADKGDRGGATIAYKAATRRSVAKLAQHYLSENYAADYKPVQLVDYWPRNEFDLVPDMLYESSNIPLQDIRSAVREWPYSQKAEVFEAYIGERLNRRQRPGRALEKAHYSWDIVSDFIVFRDLQHHRLVDDLEWQQLTPRYGYAVPKAVEDAGLSDYFEACFDISLQLHSYLQSMGYHLESQYATLLGHRMRWKVTYNAREAFYIHERLQARPQDHPEYQTLIQRMHERLAEIHPVLADAMKFVNQGEDSELDELAAERYAAFQQTPVKAGKIDK